MIKVNAPFNQVIPWCEKTFGPGVQVTLTPYILPEDTRWAYDRLIVTTFLYFKYEKDADWCALKWQ